MRTAMTTQLPESTKATAAMKPEERLALSRSEIVNFMQQDNQLLQILKPVVARYAKANPMKTLGIAAGVGAAIVVLKPWRLISIGSLLAVLKARL
jgi:ElaB/YqjD/DUF883 family membrane-anchored ribosome-binding protein